MDLFDLKGKTALITGASQGLGARFAETLSNAGAQVILVARNVDKLKDITKKIRNNGGKALYIKIDVSDKKSVQVGIDELIKQVKTIDILINNAAISLLTPVFDSGLCEEHINEDCFEDMIQTNVLGAWYFIKAIANHMKDKNIKGSIINIASVCGANKLRSNLTGYCASKAAVIQMTKALVGELSTTDIRINCIVPGLFHSPMTDHRVGVKETKKEIEQTIPLHFVANPTHFDGAVLYLASNKASQYVTGSCITVDGGVSWGGAYDYYVFQGVVY